MSSSYKSFAVLSFSGSRKPIGRLSEDAHVFLHVDGVCFAKQPLGHLDLLFAPPPRGHRCDTAALPEAAFPCVL